MKLTTRLYIEGRIGRWISTAGAVLGVLGLVLKFASPFVDLSNGLLVASLMLIAFGIGLHAMMGDEEPIPPAVAEVLEPVDAAKNERTKRR